jgi:predicted glycogen debranching enzyme
LIAKEWLVTNGIGGYASSTLPSVNTRKYHGLLVASMAPPVRRMVLLSRVEETISFGGNAWSLASNEYAGIVHPRGFEFLRAFSASPMPRWAYQGDGWTIEKTLTLLHGENAVCLSYTLLAGDHPVELNVRPLLALRPIHELMYQWNGPLVVEKRGKRQYRVPPTARTPEVFFAHDGAFGGQPAWYLNTIYRHEPARGYAGLEDVWSPAELRWTLYPGQAAHFVCSADPIDFDATLARVQHQCESEAMAEVAFDADRAPVPLQRSIKRFVLDLPADMMARRGPCVTQYPWATPSVRDLLIGFTGTYLVTGQFEHARSALLGVAGTLRDGLIATSFPEDGSGPIYRGADVSLWFVNAVHEYLRYTDDRSTVAKQLLEPVLSIVAAYEGPTVLGTSIDTDGLLQTRCAGIAATWMDAQLGVHPITPRTGKAVELNALWHNALCIAADLCAANDHVDEAAALRHRAEQVKAAFNATFWNVALEACYDVVAPAGPDASIRPNQVLAASLPYPVLSTDRHVPMLETVRDHLLTPWGLRTLSPSDGKYVDRYQGNVVARDRALHNGAVYPWLLGPFIAAWVNAHARSPAARAQAAGWLQHCIDYAGGIGVGYLPELFAGDAPHAPGGAVASLPSIAEVLRAYIEDCRGEPIVLPTHTVPAPAASESPYVPH